MGALFHVQRGVGVVTPSARAKTTPPRRGSGGYSRTMPVSSAIPARRLSAGVAGAPDVAEAADAESVATVPRALSGTTAATVVVSCFFAADLLSTTSHAVSAPRPRTATATRERVAGRSARCSRAGRRTKRTMFDRSGIIWRILLALMTRAAGSRACCRVGQGEGHDQ